MNSERIPTEVEWYRPEADTRSPERSASRRSHRRWPAESAASRRELVPIAVVMLATFLVTFTVMYWQRKAEGPGRGTPLSVGAAIPTFPALRALPASAQTRSALPTPVRESAEPLGKVTAPYPGSPSSLPPIPVTVAFLPRTERAGDESDPDKTITVYLGRVWNRSAEPMALDILRESAGAGTAQTALTLEAHRAKGFGESDGVDLHAGDTVTIRRSGFADLVVQVH